MSSEQQDTVALDAEVADEGNPQARLEHARDAERKLPQETVASLIAKRLGIRDDEEAIRLRLQQLVRTFGRTQSLSLCDQVSAPSEEPENVGEPHTRATRFFALVEAKGRPKQRRSQHGNTVQALQNQKSKHESQVKSVARMIAEQLDEREATVRKTFARSVKTLGIETVLSLLLETHNIEAAGGMMLPDGSRRRTPGGVFFFLVKQTADAAQQKHIFGYVSRAARGEPLAPPPPGTVPSQRPLAPPAFLWSERHTVLQEIDERKGEIRAVKITLIGRPGTVVERGQCIVMTMQQGPTIPSLPKGLPVPPRVEATTYTVYIASKQWRKVTEALKDQDDALIVEGWPMLDAKEGRIAVFANNVTTKKLQIAQKQAQSHT